MAIVFLIFFHGSHVGFSYPIHLTKNLKESSYQPIHLFVQWFRLEIYRLHLHKRLSMDWSSSDHNYIHEVFLHDNLLGWVTKFLSRSSQLILYMFDKYIWPNFKFNEIQINCFSKIFSFFLLFSVLIYQFGNFLLSFHQTFHPNIHVSIRWNLYRIFSIHSKEIFI